MNENVNKSVENFNKKDIYNRFTIDIGVMCDLCGVHVFFIFFSICVWEWNGQVVHDPHLWSAM